MKNEIEVGEYVRNKGLIFCIMGIDYDDYITDIIYNPEIHKGYKGRYDFGVKDYLLYFTKEQISKMKHSSNLIDLICEGDYVNGRKIESIEDISHKHNSIIVVYDGELWNEEIRGEDIETIVTKEQFENISYKVKE